jgi:copper chaperone CopZ
MFNFFNKKKQQGTTATFKIEGMHCASCAMNIDGVLEDTPGVASATSNYARAELVVEFDPQQVTIPQLKKITKELGYALTEK